MSGSSKLNDMVFDVGDYVELTQNRKGTIQFEGNIKFIGYVYGIELDEAIPGGTDGLLLGVRYFKCHKKRATFVKATKIKSILKPFASTNRIRKALHLPINKKKKKKKKNNKKKNTNKTTKSKAQNNKHKRKKQLSSKAVQLPTLIQSDSEPIHSNHAFSSRKRNTTKHGKPSLSLSGSAAVSSYNPRSKSKMKPSRKRVLKKHNSTDTPSSKRAPPHTPRPRNKPPKRRSKSSMKLNKTQRERYMGKHTFGKPRGQRTEVEKVPKDVNQRLKCYLQILSTLSPFKKRQEALKQCIAILSHPIVSKTHKKKAFAFESDVQNTVKTASKAHALKSGTLKYFVDHLKKPFWKQIDDKKLSIQKEAIHLLHVVIKYHWIYIKKYATYYAKRILLYFEKNDVKSTRKLIEPTMKLLNE